MKVGKLAAGDRERLGTHGLGEGAVPYDGGQSVVVLAAVHDDHKRQRDHLEDTLTHILYLQTRTMERESQ